MLCIIIIIIIIIIYIYIYIYILGADLGGAQFDLGGCNDLPGKRNQNFSRDPRAFKMLLYISYRHASVVTSHANYMQSLVIAN